MVNCALTDLTDFLFKGRMNYCNDFNVFATDPGSDFTVTRLFLTGSGSDFVYRFE